MVFTESTLSTSYVFEMFNINKKMTTQIAEAYKRGQKLDISYIEEQILQIRRTKLSPLCEDVIHAYEEGRIELVYSEYVKVPTAIPFVVLRMRGINKGIIFINNFGTIQNGNEISGGHSINVPMKTLYALMEGAYIAIHYYDFPDKMARSLGLMKVLAGIYSDMMVRILSRDYALALNQEVFSSVSYIFARFFMEKVYEGENSSVIHSYAMQTATSSTRGSLPLLGDEYTHANINTISDVIDYLRNTYPTFNDPQKLLTTRYFIEYYIRTYKESAALALDTLPYFIFVIICAMIGCPLVKYEVIGDIIKHTRGNNIIYSEIVKSI